MLNRLKGILDGLHVYPDRMLKNMNRSYGLYNSQRVLLALTGKGMSHEAMPMRLYRGMRCRAGRRELNSKNYY